MIMQILHCPHCQGTDIIRHGKTRQGKQRYCCQETVCDGRTFLLEYSYAGHSAEIKQQIVDMAMNASGIRDTARVLHVSPTTVIKELKKKEPELQSVNHRVLASVHPEQVEIEIWRADELEVRRGLSSELDEMWSFVQAKAHPRWLWHAIDHHTGKVLAYVFGRRKDAVFLYLAPSGRTLLISDVPDASPTAPSHPQVCQRELCHGLFLPVNSSSWRAPSAGTIPPALDRP